MARSVMSLLRVVALLVVAGVVAMHVLPAVHHAAAAHPLVAVAPDALPGLSGEHHAAGVDAHSDDGCDLACQTGTGAVMLCLAVLGAVLSFLARTAPRGRALCQRVRPPPFAAMYRPLPLLRAPDPVADLCISRT